MSRPSKVYYETGLIGSGTWVEDTEFVKMRVVDSLNNPRWAEVIVKDHDHAKQIDGRFDDYKRIKLVDGETSEVIFLGRVEFCEAENDPEGNGPVLKLQARDYLSEFADIAPIDFDFNATLVVKQGLFKNIIERYRYTELIVTGVSGGDSTFHAGNWIVNKTAWPIENCAKIIYWKPETGQLVVTSVWGGSSLEAGDVITEQIKDPNTGGFRAAFGYESGVTGTISSKIFNIALTSLPTTAYTDIGNFTNNSMSVLKALQQVAVQNDESDFYATNGTSPELYPVTISYSSRATRAAATPALTLGYSVTPTDVVMTYNADYEFPVPAKERSTYVKIVSTAPGATPSDPPVTIVGESFNGASAATLRNTKMTYTQNADTSTVAALDDQAGNLASKMNTKVQRGKVKVDKYPFYKSGGNYFIMRAGNFVIVQNSRLSTVHNTKMMIVSIDYEEAPGIATINLIGDGSGIASAPYDWSSPDDMGIQVITEPVDARITQMIEPIPPWSDILPQAVQGYTTDLHFVADDADTVSWTSTTGIKFYDGTVRTVAAGNTGNLATDAIYYIYFDTTIPATGDLTLQVDTIDHYVASHLSITTGTLCVIQRNSSGGLATILPSYGKEPHISTDWIDMSGLKDWTDPVYGGHYTAIMSTQFQAGYLKLTAQTYKEKQWYAESGVIIDATAGIDIFTSGGIDMAFTTSKAVGYISAFNPNDGTSKTAITTSVEHGLAVGARITISGTTNYNGKYIIEAANTPTTYNFKIAKAYIAEAGGATKLARSVQCYVDTNGAISAGAGLVTLDSGGLNINSGHIWPYTSGMAIYAHDDLLIGTDINGGINLTAGAIAGTAPNNNSITLRSGGGTRVAGVDNLMICSGSGLTLSSGDEAGEASANDIMINAADDIFLYCGSGASNYIFCDKVSISTVLVLPYV